MARDPSDRRCHRRIALCRRDIGRQLLVRRGVHARDRPPSPRLGVGGPAAADTGAGGPRRHRGARFGGRAADAGESYIVAAYADGYAGRYDLPRAFSTNRSYGYFAPPPEDDDAALFVGRDPGMLSPYFADTREVAEINDEIAAYLLTGRRQPWEHIWAQTRTLTVM